MRKTLTTFALMLAAAPAFAEITWNVAALDTGAMRIMKDRVGATTHIKRGEINGLHSFDVFEGKGAAAVKMGQYQVTETGNLVAMIAVDGAETRFAPHRCSRTLGTCQFTVTHPGGFSEPRTRVTKQTSNGLRYWEYGMDGLLVEGALTLDENGTAIGGWQKENGKPKRRIKKLTVASN